MLFALLAGEKSLISRILDRVAALLPRSASFRRKNIRILDPYESEWIGKVDDNVVSDLLREIYRAAKCNLTRLTAMGVRSLLEHIMISKSGDRGRFADNIQAFFDDGHISASHRQTFETILEAGHATTHRGFKPTEDEIRTLLATVEMVIKQMYVSALPASPLSNDKVEALGARIPPRVK